MSGVLLESKPFRPFKSSEEYLYAMKEDLAEWFNLLYPHLDICVYNFMEKLETGVALCEHANSVKLKAYEYIEKKQARKLMTRSVTGSLALAQTVYEIADVKYFATAKPGTFFARDNLSNFIQWCKQLDIYECLLFESDDLILRKNEKNVILCLLEVARRGAKFGMLAPMLIQMERQIDREILADQRRSGYMNDLSDGTDTITDDLDETDSEMEDEQPPVLVYGPIPQIVTNDLKSLDEMVRDLVEKCTCPTQFPMIRVSEGKYRIGDTKVLIFVRILRNHVMVRVGGGWDTLSHYLDKHDPCRCRSQHRQTQGARLVNKPGASDLAGAQVYYDRSPQRQLNGTTVTDSPLSGKKDYLGPPMNSLNRSRSRSPSYVQSNDTTTTFRRSASPNLTTNKRYLYATNNDRSRSPTPNFTSTHVTKLSRSPQKINNDLNNDIIGTKKSQNLISAIQIPCDNNKQTLKSEATLVVNDSNDHSDNASEMSDEGYRSLGVIDKGKLRTSLCSQNSTENAEDNEHQETNDYMDETNDCGLRKTSFSKIYTDTDKQSQQFHQLQQLQQQQKKDVQIVNNADTKTPRSRSSSIEGGGIGNTLTSYMDKNQCGKLINNTWNGRQKQQRIPLNPDLYSPNFARNSNTRRSLNKVQYDHNGRRLSQSANTSPTKTNLRQELMSVLKSTNNEILIAREVEKLVKQYSMTSLNGSDDSDVDSPKRKGNNNNKRKDSRTDVGMSKIPVPLTHKGY